MRNLFVSFKILSFSGGWLAVANITFEDPSDITPVLDNPSHLSQLQNIQSGRVLLHHDLLQSLFVNNGYTELRIKCYKPWHGRTLHTILHGDKIDKYIKKESTYNGICGNVRFLPDDNSVMSTANCEDLRMGHSYYGHKYYNHVIFEYGVGQVILHKADSRYECDDWEQNAGYQEPGNWLFYIR